MVAAMSIQITAPATSLAERLAGEVITPDHPTYETARRVWNGMIDKRPAMIARCADADDVATAIRFAAEHGLPLAVRGGGHNVAGTAVVDDGLVIDLSAMRAVRIDDTRRTVHVQGGATWADVDRVTAPLGLATPGGVVSETGVAGLALSGGVSHQRRRDGMTVDNLVSAEVVLADGRQVRASARRAPRPVLGAARRRRQLRRRDLVRAAAARARPRGVRAQRRLPDRGRRARAGGLARRRRRRAGRAVDRRAHLVAAGRRRVARAAARPAVRRRRPACGRATRPRASTRRGACASWPPRCWT